jgi:xanthine dehydrogenase small subunit
MEHPFLLERIPQWYRFLKLISSTPIRNIGTIAGNLANASPIGDFTAILLALNAQITLLDTQNQTSRNLPLRSFYLGYKTLDKAPSEIISQMTFELPAQRLFYFDKVCKRQYLDIASVNTAISLQMSADQITEAHLSMGGVGPTPLYLSATADYLIGKKLSAQTIRAAEAILQTELSPISDARGTQDYKRLLARQLFFGHFLSLFSDSLTMQELI